MMREKLYGRRSAVRGQKAAAALLVLAFSATVMAAEPAVSGKDLENLNRASPAAADRGPQTADPATQPAEPAAEAASPTPAVTPPAADRRPQTAERGGARNDRLQLDTTVVTGNRELPKVLYIVPWKKAELGDLPGQPFNTLLDEVLTPVDRDVFRREVTYFDAVTRNAGANQSTSAPPP